MPHAAIKLHEFSGDHATPERPRPGELRMMIRNWRPAANSMSSTIQPQAHEQRLSQKLRLARQDSISPLIARFWNID